MPVTRKNLVPSCVIAGCGVIILATYASSEQRKTKFTIEISWKSGQIIDLAKLLAKHRALKKGLHDSKVEWIVDMHDGNGPRAPSKLSINISGGVEDDLECLANEIKQILCKTVPQLQDEPSDDAFISEIYRCLLDYSRMEKFKDPIILSAVTRINAMMIKPRVGVVASGLSSECSEAPSQADEQALLHDVHGAISSDNMQFIM